MAPTDSAPRRPLRFRHVLGIAAVAVLASSGAALPVTAAGAGRLSDRISPRISPPLRATLPDPEPSGTGDEFAEAIGVAGKTAIIGDADADGADGIAYIYSRGSSSWSAAPSAALADPTASVGDFFGFSAAVSGKVAVVGATGTDGGAGAAYVYVEGASGWPSTPTVTLPDPDAGSGSESDDFGISVAVSGGTIVVGSLPETGLGTAYIYTKHASTWPSTPTASLVDPQADPDDYFGYAVAVSGKTIVVGAQAANSFAGATYIYTKGPHAWPAAPTATLPDPEATPGQDFFGNAVAASDAGKIVLVGAFGTNATAGAAYLFVQGVSGWSTVPTVSLQDPSATANDSFGYALALSGRTAVVGAEEADASSGAAYVYAEGRSGWPSVPSLSLADPLGQPNDLFGDAVGASGSAVVVGAPFADTDGVAYVFKG